MFLPFFHHHADILGQSTIAQLPILLKQYYPDQQGLPAQDINALYIAWLLRDVKSTKFKRTNANLEPFKNPQFRQQFIGPSPKALAEFIHIYDKLADDKMYWQDVPFSTAQQQSIALLQQQHPILVSELFSDLAWRQPMAALCTVLIMQHGQSYHLYEEPDPLWHHAIDNAAIMMWLAQQQTSHRLRAWLAALLHGVALAAIRKHIKLAGYAHSDEQLLQDTLYYQYRLSYWIAKDWGMPEDILFSLRQRFMCDKPFSANTLMMQTAEHIAFIRDLRRHKQFSKRHCHQMLLSIQHDALSQHCDNFL